MTDGIVDYVLSLHSKTKCELDAVIRSGHPIAPKDLEGWRYRGVSLGVPERIKRMTWETFAKGFRHDGPSDATLGWNIRLEQTGIEGPTVPKMKGGEPHIFGHFTVRPANTWEESRTVVGAAVLDYGGMNPRLSGLGPTRDIIVALRPGDPTALLGWMYMKVGPARVPTPSYFTLVRDARL